jgi:carbon-monoxide dehydrogenase medium subunit
MIPASFDYHRPSSVDEAIGLLSDDAKLLAGGHSLLPAMKLRLSTPSALVDIGGLAELNYVKEEGGTIAIGAATTHHQIESSKAVKSKATALAQAAAVIGDPQVRNKGTIGGSVAHADPAADYPAAILALGAEIQVKGPDRERAIAAEEFFIDLFLTALAADEIITEIRVPTSDKSAYCKLPHPASRFAVVGCAAAANAGSVKVAFTGVANAAFRDSGVEEALGGNLSEGSIGAAAERAAAEVDVLTDNFAGEEYRCHLAKVYARKALTAIA